MTYCGALNPTWLITVLAGTLNCQPGWPGQHKTHLPESPHCFIKVMNFSRQPASHVQAGHETLGKAHMCDFH